MERAWARRRALHHGRVGRAVAEHTRAAFAIGWVMLKETLPEALTRISHLCEAVRLPFALIGDMAMILRMRPRTTFDIDVVIAARRSDVDRILRAASEVGFSHDATPGARALAEEGLVQLRGPIAGETFGADLIFADSAFLSRVVERATPVTIGGTTVPVATVEDLLLLKLEANRPIDLDDAIAVKDAFESSLDRGYLVEQSRALDLEGALASLLGTTDGSKPAGGG